MHDLANIRRCQNDLELGSGVLRKLSALTNPHTANSESLVKSYFHEPACASLRYLAGGKSIPPHGILSRNLSSGLSPEQGMMPVE